MRLLDPDALARYDRLALHVRRGLGERPGDRRFPGRPQPAGIEVEAHGTYAPGDDLRHLDWNALARLDTLLVRRYTAEREVVVHLLVDTSASMGVPPVDGKFRVACELTTALAFIALGAGDALRLALLAGDDPPATTPILRQRASMRQVAERLAASAPAGVLGLGSALGVYARRHRPGGGILISDLMTDPALLERGLRALRARRWEVVVLHVLGRHERDPSGLFEHATLRDVESGATHPVHLTAAVLARYHEVLTAHLAALAAVAARTASLYARLDTDASVAAFLTGPLAALGVVRRR